MDIIAATSIGMAVGGMVTIVIVDLVRRVMPPDQEALCSLCQADHETSACYLYGGRPWWVGNGSGYIVPAVCSHERGCILESSRSPACQCFTDDEPLVEREVGHRLKG